MRTSILISAVFVAAVAATPALAAPKLSGTYTAAADQFCEASVVNGNAVAGGDLEQFMVVMTVRGSTATLKGTDQSGPMATTTKFIGKMALDMSMAVKITGTANPYTVTLGGNAIKANFDRIDAAGIAHRAAFLSLFPNGEVAGTNCTQLIILSRH